MSSEILSHIHSILFFCISVGSICVLSCLFFEFFLAYLPTVCLTNLLAFFMKEVGVYGPMRIMQVIDNICNTCLESNRFNHEGLLVCKFGWSWCAIVWGTNGVLSHRSSSPFFTETPPTTSCSRSSGGQLDVSSLRRYPPERRSNRKSL